ncbi:MAG TPA: BlaI/MecI/CopY family transcriptional regulator [Candidatus Koribacter sp.]|jgi:predicted transcriptional regulator
MKLFRLNRQGRGTTLGPLEDRVMRMVWSAPGPVAVSEIQRKLQRKANPLAYSTVKTILTNLAAKGYLKKWSQGRTNVFAAAITQEEFEKRLVGEVLSALTSDYKGALLATLVDQVALHPQRLDDLEKLIEQKRAEMERDE